jgi:hypothetical protein
VEGRPIRCTPAAACLLVLGLTALAAGGSADSGADAFGAGPVYGWRDPQGVVRYSTRLDRVPESARAEAVRLYRDPGTGVARVAPLQPRPLLAGPPAPEDVDVAAAPPPRPAPPPAPARARPEPRPAAAEGWAIQLEAHALSEWLRPLEALGLLDQHRLYHTAAEIGGEPWERTRLGLFASLGDARAALARLAPHFPDAWIDAAGAVERTLVSEGGAVPVATPAWTLQLGARPVGARVRALARLELLEGHRLYRRTVVADGVVWERLRLGDFARIEDARAALQALRSSYPDAWIDRADG